MGSIQIDAPPGVPFVTVTREFGYPRDLVFRAHVEPDLLVRWLGPRRFEMVVERYEVRHGGAWRYVHRDAAGNEYGFHGVFHGTPSPDSTVQTFEFEGAPGHVSLNKLVLEERGGGTLVRVESVYQSVESRDATIAGGMGEGMTEGYERLEELLASLVPTH